MIVLAMLDDCAIGFAQCGLRHDYVEGIMAVDGEEQDAYERAWLNKPFSLLTTTQNTRDLGGYRTKEEVLLRSDVQNYSNEADCNF